MLDGSGYRRLFPDRREGHVPAGWAPDGHLLLAAAGRFWIGGESTLFHISRGSVVPVTSGEPRFESLTRQGRTETSYAIGTIRLGPILFT